MTMSELLLTSSSYHPKKKNFWSGLTELLFAFEQKSFTRLFCLWQMKTVHERSYRLQNEDTNRPQTSDSGRYQTELEATMWKEPKEKFDSDDLSVTVETLASSSEAFRQTKSSGKIKISPSTITPTTKLPRDNSGALPPVCLLQVCFPECEALSWAWRSLCWTHTLQTNWAKVQLVDLGRSHFYTWSVFLPLHPDPRTGQLWTHPIILLYPRQSEVIHQLLLQQRTTDLWLSRNLFQDCLILGKLKPYMNGVMMGWKSST